MCDEDCASARSEGHANANTMSIVHNIVYQFVMSARPDLDVVVSLLLKRFRATCGQLFVGAAMAQLGPAC